MPAAVRGNYMFEEWRATPVEAGESAGQTVPVPGRPSSLAGHDAITYKSSFSDPRDAADDVAVLELRGVYAHAEIELTGDRLDGDGVVEHDAYFDPVRIPFEPYDENELVVTCEKPRDRFGGLHDTDTVPEESAVPGIWWDVALESRPLPFVDSIEVHPEITADGATLNVRTTVVTDGPLEDRITYSLKPEGDHTSRGMMDRATVEAPGPGKTTVEHSIEVRDPALWWPRNYGDQNRYTLRAKLGDSEHSVTTGICDISRDGSEFRVNGEAFSIRGLNAFSDDVADVSRLVDVNANLVRAHAHVLPQEFYAACDEAGILVWQDLPLTGPDEFDTERATVLARRLAGVRGRHPSLACYGVHDDPVAAFADGLGSGVLDTLRLRWRAWRSSYDRSAAETVAQALPERRPVFPVVGGPGTEPDAAAYYPGWAYGQARDIDSLLDRYPADVVAEFGAASLGRDGVTEAAGFDTAKHDRHVDGGLEASQRYQSSVIGTVAERLRTDGHGAIASALRDTDNAGMGIYTVEGEPKVAKKTLERTFAPVQAFLTDPSPGETPVVVVNDTSVSRSATVEWEAGGESGQLDVTVTGNGRWEGGPIAIPDSATAVTLRTVFQTQTVENRYDLS